MATNESGPVGPFPAWVADTDDGRDEYDRMRRRLLWTFPSGLYVVGSRAGERRNAMTLNWCTQVSFEPKLLAISVEKPAVTHELITAGQVFSVCTIDREDRAIVRKFTKPVDVDLDAMTLNGFGFRDGATGVPILTQAVAFVECQVRQTVDCGGHSLFVGEVVDSDFLKAEDTPVLRMEDTRMNYGAEDVVAFPEHGTSEAELLTRIDTMAEGDIDWRGGRAFSLVYHPDDAGLESLLHQVAAHYLHENALNPFKYPSLVEMEAEVVAMAGDLFHTMPKAGSMSSGGTESIFLAVHTARSRAEAEADLTDVNIVTADTVHPAFAKACHYLRVEHRKAPIRADRRADPKAMAALVDERTALIVGSAPCYPFGVIDPIGELAALAIDAGTLMHVDACLGGWLLPWWERLGEPVPPWDFRVEGVTSLSADVHKYGYTFKGASLIMYRDPSLVRYQRFLYDEWPGGLYGSITTAGTRPAAPIAGAWAAINYLGADGYLAKARQVRDTTRAFQAAIAAIDGIEVRGVPDMSVFELGASPGSAVDIGGVGDVMDDRGRNLDRQQGGLHVMVSPYHQHAADQFVADLAEAVATHGTSAGKAASYGGVVDP